MSVCSYSKTVILKFIDYQLIATHCKRKYLCVWDIVRIFATNINP